MIGLPLIAWSNAGSDRSHGGVTWSDCQTQAFVLWVCAVVDLGGCCCCVLGLRSGPICAKERGHSSPAKNRVEKAIASGSPVECGLEVSGRMPKGRDAAGPRDAGEN